MKPWEEQQKEKEKNSHQELFEKDKLVKLTTTLLMDYVQNLTKYVTKDLDDIPLSNLRDFCQQWVDANIKEPFHNEKKAESFTSSNENDAQATEGKLTDMANLSEKETILWSKYILESSSALFMKNLEFNMYDSECNFLTAIQGLITMYLENKKHKRSHFCVSCGIKFDDGCEEE